MSCGVSDIARCSGTTTRSSKIGCGGISSIGSGSGCGGGNAIIDEVEVRRENDYLSSAAVNSSNGKAIWSEELEKELGNGYKIIKSVPSCHGQYYEAYEIDDNLAEAIIDLISKKRENEEEKVIKFRR